MKTCTKCSKLKLENEFSKDSYAKSGLSFICKGCSKIKSFKYKKTKGGLISVIYSNQISNARKRGRRLPNYTKAELTEWMNLNNFNELYNKWKAEGYIKDLVPSCDRFSDYDEYELCKLQLITWKENNSKHYKDVLEGRNTKHTKPVIGINMITGLEVEYYSITDASRKTGINRTTISDNVNGKTVRSVNYKFKFKN